MNREPLPHLTPDVELLGNCDSVVNQLCGLLGEGWEEPLHQELLRQTEELTLPANASERETTNGPSEKPDESAATETTVSDAVDKAKAEVLKPDTSDDDGEADPPRPDSADGEESSSSSVGHHWQPRRNISWSARLTPGTFFFKPPNRQVFYQ